MNWITRSIGGLGAVAGGLAGLAITLLGLLGLGQSRPEYWGNYGPFLVAGIFLMGSALLGFIGLVGPSPGLLLLAALLLGIPSVFAGAAAFNGPGGLNPLLVLVFALPSLFMVIAAGCAVPASRQRPRTTHL